MDWCQIENKLLPEPVMTHFTDAQSLHICNNKPSWMNTSLLSDESLQVRIYLDLCWLSSLKSLFNRSIFCCNIHAVNYWMRITIYILKHVGRVKWLTNNSIQICVTEIWFCVTEISGSCKFLVRSWQPRGHESSVSGTYNDHYDCDHTQACQVFLTTESVQKYNLTEQLCACG